MKLLYYIMQMNICIIRRCSFVYDLYCDALLEYLRKQRASNSPAENQLNKSCGHQHNDGLLLLEYLREQCGVGLQCQSLLECGNPTVVLLLESLDGCYCC